MSCGDKIPPGKEILKNKDEIGFINTVLKIQKDYLRN
jgi:hypothetical protein